jgi:hypothetical protein
VNQQMLIRGGHIHDTALDGLTVLGQSGLNWPCSVKQVGQASRTIGRRVLNHENRRRQIIGELSGKFQKRLHPSRRSPNHDDVMMCHAASY